MANSPLENYLINHGDETVTFSASQRKLNGSTMGSMTESQGEAFYSESRLVRMTLRAVTAWKRSAACACPGLYTPHLHPRSSS